MTRLDPAQTSYDLMISSFWLCFIFLSCFLFGFVGVSF